MRRIVAPLFVLVLATACASASSQRPANFPAPEVRVEPIGSMFFGSGDTAPITLEVEVANRAQTTLRIREIEITSPGMSTYALRPVRRFYNEAVEAGSVKQLTLFTTAVTLVRDPSEPLTIRTIITFEADGSRWREVLQR